MSTEDACKLFVAGLPESITEDVLRQLFEATGGTVTNVSLPRDRATGRPRGFGFVTLATADEAERARGSLDGSLQAGRPISVRRFQSEAPRRGESRPDGGPPAAAAAGADRTLYVGNLPYDTTQADVEALFNDNGAGPVVRVHLPIGPDGRPRGFGFITLGSAEAANGAIAALANVDMRGRRLIINVAHPRGERSDRPERSDRSRAPRRDDAGGGGGGGGFAPDSMPMPDEPRRDEGRRRATKPERPDNDARKKRGVRSETKEPKRRGRSDWKNWDKDD